MTTYVEGVTVAPPMEMSRRAVAVVLVGALAAGAALWHHTDRGMDDLQQVISSHSPFGGDTHAQAAIQHEKPKVDPVLPCDSWVRGADIENQLYALITRKAQEKIIDTGLSPGVTVAIGCGDNMLAATALGRSGSKVVMSPGDTEMDIASGSKHLTGVGIMMLRDEGKLRLSDRVDKFVPELNHGRSANITIKMLLQHQSGLNEGEDYDPLLRGASSPAQLKRKLLRYKPKAEPNQGFNYSNLGYYYLYLAGSAAAGEPFEDYMQEKLLSPIGMKHTAMGADAENCASTSPYAPAGSSRLKTAYTCTPRDRLGRALGGKSGHATWFSSAMDLGRLMGMEANKGYYDGRKYLSGQSLADLTTTQANYPYGMASRVNTRKKFSNAMSRRAAGHTGDTGCVMMQDPTTGLYGVMLTNETLYAPAKLSRTYKAYKSIIDPFILSVTPKAPAAQ